MVKALLTKMLLVSFKGTCSKEGFEVIKTNLSSSLITELWISLEKQIEYSLAENGFSFFLQPWL